MPSPKRVSVDTNFLINLAVPRRFASQFLEAHQRRGMEFIVTETVIAECQYLAEKSPDKERRYLAGMAVQLLPEWEFKLVYFSDEEADQTEKFARDIVRQGWLPPAEFSDAVIIAESALAAAPVLVSSDRRMRDIRLLIWKRSC